MRSQPPVDPSLPVEKKEKMTGIVCAHLTFKLILKDTGAWADFQAKQDEFLKHAPPEIAAHIEEGMAYIEEMGGEDAMLESVCPDVVSAHLHLLIEKAKEMKEMMKRIPVPEPLDSSLPAGGADEFEMPEEMRRMVELQMCHEALVDELIELGGSMGFGARQLVEGIRKMKEKVVKHNTEEIKAKLGLTSDQQLLTHCYDGWMEFKTMMHKSGAGGQLGGNMDDMIDQCSDVIMEEIMAKKGLQSHVDQYKAAHANSTAADGSPKPAPPSGNVMKCFFLLTKQMEKMGSQMAENMPNMPGPPKNSFGGPAPPQPPNSGESWPPNGMVHPMPPMPPMGGGVGYGAMPMCGPTCGPVGHIFEHFLTRVVGPPALPAGVAMPPAELIIPQPQEGDEEGKPELSEAAIAACKSFLALPEEATSQCCEMRKACELAVNLPVEN